MKFVERRYFALRYSRLGWFLATFACWYRLRTGLKMFNILVHEARRLAVFLSRRLIWNKLVRIPAFQFTVHSATKDRNVWGRPMERENSVATRGRTISSKEGGACSCLSRRKARQI